MREAKHPLAYAPRYLVFFLKLFPHFSPSSFLKLLSLFPQACPFLERLSCPPKIFSLSPFNTFPPAFFSHFHLFSSSSSLYSLSYVTFFRLLTLPLKDNVFALVFQYSSSYFLSLFSFHFLLKFHFLFSPVYLFPPFCLFLFLLFLYFSPRFVPFAFPLSSSSISVFISVLFTSSHPFPFASSPSSSSPLLSFLHCVLFLCVLLLSFLPFLSFDSCPSPLPILPPASSPLPRTTPVLYP